MSHRLALAAGAILLILATAGCALGAPSRATPSSTSVSAEPSASTSPSPSPAPASLVLGPQYTRALDDSGTELWRFDYDSDPAVAQSLLTRSFGEPSVTEHEGTSNSDADLPSTVYGWNGLDLEVTHFAEGSDVSGDGYSNYAVIATRAEVHGIPVITPSGVSVGMSRAEVDSRFPSSDATAPDNEQFRNLEPWTRTKDGSELIDWVSARFVDGRVERLYATAHSYGA